MSDNIVPFGKYKGKQIEEVLSCDPQYFEWAKTQEWFKEKYSITYNQVVNIFNPEKKRLFAGT